MLRGLRGRGLRCGRARCEPTRIGIHQDVYRTTRLLDITTVLVTHDLAEAISLADRVIILSKRPATVAHEHFVPFGTEREMLELRHTQPFLELYGRLWQDLSGQMEA
jgi:NitT/TauT family transport system ATP-binding protein